MSSLLTTVLLSSLAIQCYTQTTCTSGDCVFDCSQENCNEIVCTDGADSCTILCGENDCQESIFYLAATNNTVICDGSDSCKLSAFYCGQPPSDSGILGENQWSLSSFDGHINECTFRLSNNAISDGGLIRCFHDIDVCQVFALTNNDDFKASQFQCELSPLDAQCSMYCERWRSCGGDTTQFTCSAPDCTCTGDGCGSVDQSIGTAPPSTSNLGMSTTLRPSSVPTIQPTISMTTETGELTTVAPTTAAPTTAAPTTAAPTTAAPTTASPIPNTPLPTLGTVALNTAGPTTSSSTTSSTITSPDMPSINPTENEKDVDEDEDMDGNDQGDDQDGDNLNTGNSEPFWAQSVFFYAAIGAALCLSLLAIVFYIRCRYKKQQQRQAAEARLAFEEYQNSKQDGANGRKASATNTRNGGANIGKPPLMSVTSVSGSGMSGISSPLSDAMIRSMPDNISSAIDQAQLQPNDVGDAFADFHEGHAVLPQTGQTTQQFQANDAYGDDEDHDSDEKAAEMDDDDELMGCVTATMGGEPGDDPQLEYGGTNNDNDDGDNDVILSMNGPTLG